MAVNENRTRQEATARRFRRSTGIPVPWAAPCGIALLGSLLPLAASPAHAAPPGPECTILEVVVSDIRNFDPRYAGTLASRPDDGPRPRAAATVRRQSTWKARAPATPPAATAG